MSQRDFLAQQAEEQRSHWTSEADGWMRMAEALIAQRHHPGNPSANDEVCFYSIRSAQPI
jgi:hypothetical protein